MISLSFVVWEAWYMRSVDGENVDVMRLPIVAISDHQLGGAALVMSPKGHLVSADEFDGDCDAPWVFAGVSHASRFSSLESVEFCGVKYRDSRDLVEEKRALALEMARDRAAKAVAS